MNNAQIALRNNGEPAGTGCMMALPIIGLLMLAGIFFLVILASS
jgi:hypothetical protein